MPSRNPSGTYKLGSLLTLFYHYRISSSSSSLVGHNHGLWISTRPLGYNYGSSMHGGHRLFSSTSMAYRKYKWFDMLNETNDKIQVEAPIPDTPNPKFSFSTWAKGFVGSILSLMLAYLKQKWDNLQKLEGKLEKTAEEVEYVTEVVEKVATTTEKVSKELADKLPGNGKLKQTALMVQHLSTIVASDAQLTENFIHKIDHLKQDFEDLEKLVEPVVYGNKEVKHG